MTDESVYDIRVISLGAGVQSTAMLLMSDCGVLPRVDAAIFADTGWEPSLVYENLERLEKTVSIPIHRVQAGNIKDNALALRGQKKVGQFGQPPFYVRNQGEARGGRLWRRCTNDYKVIPIQAKIRDLLGYAKWKHIRHKAQQWIGITTDEASRMKDSRVHWIDNLYPLVDMMYSRNDCVKWLEDNGHPVPIKSSCLGCPFHSNKYWKALKRVLPDEYTEAVEFDHQLRSGGKIPGVKGDAFVHYSMKPLDEAVEAHLQRDEPDLFGNECEGLCGV